VGQRENRSVSYTHYWRVATDVDPAKIAEAGREMAKVVKASTVPLAGAFGEPGTSPRIELDTGTVWFNGVEDEDYETFAWPPSRDEPSSDPSRTFSFCKTSWQPYDHVVVACLLAAQRVLGDKIEISSDGGVNDFLDQTESWSESARSLYTRTFAEPPVVPPRIVGNVNLLR
jgi:hypothetical protein